MMKDKTFLELCEEVDIIKCYGQPAFFINDTLYFMSRHLMAKANKKSK